jgi:hypothetical protein
VRRTCFSFFTIRLFQPSVWIGNLDTVDVLFKGFTPHVGVLLRLHAQRACFRTCKAKLAEISLEIFYLHGDSLCSRTDFQVVNFWRTCRAWSHLSSMLAGAKQGLRSVQIAD